MKKILLLPMVILSALVLTSCENGDLSQEDDGSLSQNQMMSVQQANPAPNFTEGEKELHSKVMNLAANRMGEDFHSMSDSQREAYAINYLKEDSYRVLKENGYTDERIAAEFKSDLEVLHKALYYYSLKTNLNP